MRLLVSRPVAVCPYGTVCLGATVIICRSTAWSVASVCPADPTGWASVQTRSREFYGRKITRQGCLPSSKLLLVMKYTDLRDFMAGLERLGELKRVRENVSP